MSFYRKLDQKIRQLNHRRIDAMRALRLDLFLFLFNQKNSQDAVKSTASKSILILRLDGKLGDTITTTGFIKTLLDSGFNVDIVSRKSNAFIYQFIPGAFSLFVLNKGLIGLIKIFFKLKQKHYDVLLCSTHIVDPSSLFFSRFVKAATKIVFMNEKILFFDHHISTQFNESHVTGRYLQVLQLIQPNFNGLQPYQLHVPVGARTLVEKEILNLKRPVEKMIVLNSFAGAKLRNLSFITSRYIIEKLTQADPEVFIVSIANDGDLRILADWQVQYKNPRWIVFSRGDFAFNAALVASAAVVITPDTSIVHLASALEAPMVAIYRADVGFEKNSVIWAPISSGPDKKRHKIIYAPENDINSVNGDEVVQAALSLLHRVKS